MKRLIRTGSGRNSSLHANNNFTDGEGNPSSPSFEGIQPASRSSTRSLSAGATKTGHDNTTLPTDWNIHDPSLRAADPFSIKMNPGPTRQKTTVYANHPIPSTMDLLQSETPSRTVIRTSSGRNIFGRRRRSGDAVTSSAQGTNNTTIYPTLDEPGYPPPAQPFGSESSTKAYYFEITLSSSMPSRRRSAGAASSSSTSPFHVMIGFVASNEEAMGVFPGELPDSIGWGSEGLYVNGQRFMDGSVSARGSLPQKFVSGDVIGCGVETTGMNRVFFTYNGNIVIPPSTNTTFMNAGGTNYSPNKCFPVVGFLSTSSDSVLKTNFGLEARYPFRWSGSERMAFLVHQPAGRNATNNNGHSVSMGSLPTSSPARVDRSRSSSPYYALDLSNVDDAMSNDPGSLLTRSAHRPSLESTVSGPSSSSRYSPSTRLSTFSSGAIDNSSPSASRLSPSVYGTRSKRLSLEDDDPTTASNLEHFNLVSSSGTSTPPNWMSNGSRVPQQDIITPERSSSMCRNVRRIRCYLFAKNRLFKAAKRRAFSATACKSIQFSQNTSGCNKYRRNRQQSSHGKKHATNDTFF